MFGLVKFMTIHNLIPKFHFFLSILQVTQTEKGMLNIVQWIKFVMVNTCLLQELLEEYSVISNIMCT